MTEQRSGARRDARALRFLFLLLGGWIILRVMIAWTPAIPPPAAAEPPWSVPSPFASARLAWPKDGRAYADGEAVRAAAPDSDPPVSAAPWTGAADGPIGDMPARNATEFAGGGLIGSDRHSFRLALMAQFLPSPSSGGAARSAVASGGPMWSLPPAAARAVPGQAKPFWIQRQFAGWTLGSWLYLRDGDGAAPEGFAAASQLGGSQAGLRLAYGFGADGRARAYARATMAVRRPEQREIAFGLAFAPLARIPVDVAVERRVATGNAGRNALAAMVIAGVGDIGLPGGFRLDAYGQAGIVGARRRDGFVDGAIVVDRPLGTGDGTPLWLGGLAAGAVQPGAARLDVGPRLTLRLPNVGEGSRIAVDWRQRVAGEALPESGLALTLASDF